MFSRALVLVVVAFASAPPPLFAQAAPPDTRRSVQQVPPADDHAPDPLPSTTLRVHGTISTYDASKRLLSLTTDTGPVQFALAASSRVRRQGKKVEAQELKALAGHRAAVRYSDAGGRKTVESVNVIE